MAVLAVVYLRHLVAKRPPAALALVLRARWSSPARLALVALIAGWITTEVGRQPWIVYERDADRGGGDRRRRDPGRLRDPRRSSTSACATVVFWLLRRLARQADRGTSSPPSGARRRMSRPISSPRSSSSALTAYAVLGGADFGAGFWDLTAGGAQRGARVRGLVKRSMGPVWEANHVWLIFVLVIFWTGFPEAFGPVMSTLYVPLFLAAVGIIFRGAAFALRGEAATIGEARRARARTFALSSVWCRSSSAPRSARSPPARCRSRPTAAIRSAAGPDATSIYVGVLAVAHRRVHLGGLPRRRRRPRRARRPRRGLPRARARRRRRSPARSRSAGSSCSATTPRTSTTASPRASASRW